jgi:hypothetical protein
VKINKNKFRKINIIQNLLVKSISKKDYYYLYKNIFYKWIYPKYDKFVNNKKNLKIYKNI